ncbi:hypothetical protein ACHQM5_016783 [Ranunculus cassubicifolius]
MGILTAAALTPVPTKKKQPPSNKVAFRPKLVANRPATNDATSPAIYNDEVNAVTIWLSYTQ